MYDFWMMVQQNTEDFVSQQSDATSSQGTVQKIVMLTNFVENSRQKCEKYFPLELNEELTIRSPEPAETGFFSGTPNVKGGFLIKNTGLVKKAGYTVRKLNVRRLKSESDEDSDSELTVYHYWFHNWADHKCPKDVNALLNLSLDVLKDQSYNFSECNEEKDEQCNCNDSPKFDSKFVFPPLEAESVPCPVTVKVSSPLDLSIEKKSPPIIVHCSAGIGRTGCLIAILNGIKQLTYEQKVDVLGIVCNMRLNRGGMVQNSEQYELIHKVLCLFEQACLPSL